MAYRFIAAVLSCFAIAAALVSGGYAATVNYVREVFDFRWRPDAAASIALDRLSRRFGVKPDVGMRRLRSYRQRLDLHRLFTGDGFTEPTALASA